MSLKLQGLPPRRLLEYLLVTVAADPFFSKAIASDKIRPNSSNEINKKPFGTKDNWFLKQFKI